MATATHRETGLFWVNNLVMGKCYNDTIVLFGVCAYDEGDDTKDLGTKFNDTAAQWSSLFESSWSVQREFKFDRYGRTADDGAYEWVVFAV